MLIPSVIKKLEPGIREMKIKEKKKFLKITKVDSERVVVKLSLATETQPCINIPPHYSLHNSN